ncbi:MAG: ATP-binding protein [Victivallaceae bacterium]|nr:ATP-binding protein [Victivallaceae bacterium]
MANYHTFKIKNTFVELELLCAEINELAHTSSFSEQLLFCLNVCLEEMLSNIIKYAYDDEDKHEIAVRLEISNELITLTIIDDGHEFNPLESKIPDMNADIKHREVGGIGIFLTCKMANKVIYARKDNKNILKVLLTPHVVIL